MRTQAWLIFLLLTVPRTAVSEGEPSTTDLSETITLDALYSDGYFDSDEAPNIRWMEDGRYYTVLEPSVAHPDHKDLVRYDPASGQRKVLVPARKRIPAGHTEPLVIDDYTFSPQGDRLLIYTNSKKVWRLNTRGDYWVLTLKNGSLAKLGGDAAASTLMFAKFSPDGGRVAYVHERNIYVESVSGDNSGRSIVTLTETSSDTLINGTFDWVYEEELGLADGFRWSPDGSRIAYWQLDSSGIGMFHLLDNTAGLYPELKSFQYPKAGTTNSSCRIGVVSAEGGETAWLTDHDDPRNHYLARLKWTGSSEAGGYELAVQHLNRKQNVLTVLLGDPNTGQYRTMMTDPDDAWVDAVDAWTWLDEGRSFLWVSDRDGWRHVYLIGRDGETSKLLTPGEMDVVSVESVDPEGGWLYFVASPGNPLDRYLFRTRLDGSDTPQRLTPADAAGFHGYDVAPGGGWAIHTYSRFGVPPVVDLIELPSHKSQRVLVANDNLKKRVAALKHGEQRFFQVDIGDGVHLDAWEMRPPGFDPSKKYPVLFYVYGEPWGQTVQNSWGGDRYLWHLMLSQQGYLVISVDNRGTRAPQGREWRKILYKKIGILSSEEQAAAARKIFEWDYVDDSRVGIWGWSGGGSMTLNMLFRYPELYHTGMSVAPVPDQRFYDTIYQERYQGLPDEDAEAYRLGSPITFAEHLEGSLLLVHGTGDDNVHYQGMEALINRLIELGKPFSMMAYPNRSHSISEGDGTTRHLQGLLTRYLHQNLPPGGL